METLKEKYPSEDIKSVMTKVEAEQGKIFEIYSLEPQKIDDESVNYPRVCMENIFLKNELIIYM